MKWFSAIELVFIALIAQSHTTHASGDAVWLDSDTAEAVLKFFTDFLFYTRVFTDEQISEVRDMCDAITSLMESMVLLNKSSSTIIQALNMAFASSVSKLIVTEDGGAPLEQKREKVIDGFKAAYQYVVGKEDLVFMNEINELITTFVNESKSKNQLVGYALSLAENNLSPKIEPQGAISLNEQNQETSKDVVFSCDFPVCDQNVPIVEASSAVDEINRVQAPLESNVQTSVEESLMDFNYRASGLVQQNSAFIPPSDVDTSSAILTYPEVGKLDQVENIRIPAPEVIYNSDVAAFSPVGYDAISSSDRQSPAGYDAISSSDRQSPVGAVDIVQNSGFVSNDYVNQEGIPQPDQNNSPVLSQADVVSATNDEQDYYEEEEDEDEYGDDYELRSYDYPQSEQYSPESQANIVFTDMLSSQLFDSDEFFEAFDGDIFVDEAISAMILAAKEISQILEFDEVATNDLIDAVVYYVSNAGPNAGALSYANAMSKALADVMIDYGVVTHETVCENADSFADAIKGTIRNTEPEELYSNYNRNQEQYYQYDSVPESKNDDYYTYDENDYEFLDEPLDVAPQRPRLYSKSATPRISSAASTILSYEKVNSEALGSILSQLRGKISEDSPYLSECEINSQAYLEVLSAMLHCWNSDDIDFIDEGSLGNSMAIVEEAINFTG